MNAVGLRLRDALKVAITALTRAGIDSPEREALFLIASVIGIRPLDVHIRWDDLIGDDAKRRIDEAITRRSGREPSQYITGEEDFYGRTFMVNPSVLIPRPETELLVERALALLAGGTPSPMILDLCAGSGCIGVTLACEIDDAFVVCADISSDALCVASENAARLGVADRMEFIRSDLFAALGRDDDMNGYDLIVSNPPYVPSAVIDSLEPEVRLHEPRRALSGGADGLDFYRAIVRDAPAYLADGGALVMEMGAGQATAIRRMIEASGALRRIEIVKDLSGIDRIVTACLPQL